jgi:hypothetical protein
VLFQSFLNHQRTLLVPGLSCVAVTIRCKCIVKPSFELGFGFCGEKHVHRDEMIRFNVEDMQKLRCFEEVFHLLVMQVSEVLVKETLSKSVMVPPTVS